MGSGERSGSASYLNPSQRISIDLHLSQQFSGGEGHPDRIRAGPSVADSMYEEFKEPLYAAPPLLLRMVAAGHLGRKSGAGFYSYL